jgi:acyl-CoA thioesterase-1
LVAGVGDPNYQGWVGRVCARAYPDGLAVTSYNLGVRGETSTQVLRRWQSEMRPRIFPEARTRLVVSFGVNDTMTVGAGTRVSPTQSTANLTALVMEARTIGIPSLIVGPTPTTNPEQNGRIEALDEGFHAVAVSIDVPYVSVFAALSGDPTWSGETTAGDGAHPSANGYQRLAELVYPVWRQWLSSSADN